MNKLNNEDKQTEKSRDHCEQQIEMNREHCELTLKLVVHIPVETKKKKRNRID